MLSPERLEDWVGKNIPVRIIDLFVDAIDLAKRGVARTVPASMGRPGHHPSVLLKLFIYGYLNRVPDSHTLEREAGRNVEVMWPTDRLVPDHKTIADFRREFDAAGSGCPCHGDQRAGQRVRGLQCPRHGGGRDPSDRRA